MAVKEKEKRRLKEGQPNVPPLPEIKQPEMKPKIAEGAIDPDINIEQTAAQKPEEKGAFQKAIEFEPSLNPAPLIDKGIEALGTAITDQLPDNRLTRIMKRQADLGTTPGQLLTQAGFLGALSNARGIARVGEEIFRGPIHRIPQNLPIYPKTGATGVMKPGGTAVNEKVSNLMRNLMIAGGASLLLIRDTLQNQVFAGFIGGEENIQTIGIAYRSAEAQGDLIGMQDALNQEREAIEFAKTLPEKLPFEDAIAAVNRYVVDAEFSNELRQKQLDDRKKMSNETFEETIERVKEEEAAGERELTSMFEIRQRLQFEWEQNARAEAREEEAAFWRAERKKTEEAQRRMTEENRRFWLEYRKSASRRYI